ncbi:MAG: TIGR04219 family outer membrane beta-barrel protein, partial [Gammaproteobacteria bacterium]|nr:TIGR04219 family outer membrane beta-barrel protein [Gammaproteobacteria bacterium]
VSVKNDLFWDTETQGYFFASFEHFIPLVPNVKLAYTKTDQSGEGQATFTFDGIAYSGNVKNDVSVEIIDLIAYYELLDNIVSIDLGIDVRNINADSRISQTGTTFQSSDSFNETFPMLYVLVGASPWPGLIFSGEVSYVTYSGSDVSDLTAKVAYTTDYFVGFEAGYRKQNYNFDDISNTDSNLSFDGVFAGAYVKF